MSILKKLKFLAKIIKKEWLFFLFFLLFAIECFLLKPSFKELYDSIDFATIRALLAMMLITSAFKESSFFDFIAQKSFNFVKTERFLSFTFVGLSVMLSMFLTNDISLLIIVPLTISLKNIIKNDITKLIIFEAIGANVGSALTPVGNPQNIYLFRQMNIGFIEFMEKMSLIFIPSMLILAIMIWILFKNRPVTIIKTAKTHINKPLFFITSFLFILFIAGLEFSFVKYVLILIFISYLFYPKLFLKIDYFLIFTFILMFMDFYLLSKFTLFHKLFNIHGFFDVFNASVILSQIISNVPATLLLTHFSHEYLPIAYGSNIAANGLIIASLANVIALKPLKGAFLEFHKYSLIFFFFSYAAVVAILNCLI